MVFLIMRHPYTQRHFMRVYILWWVILYGTSTIAQSATIKGSITQNSKAVEYANIVLKGKALGATTDTTGNYVVEAIPAGTYTILVSALGYSNIERSIALRGNEIRTINFELIESESRFNEVVVSGTMKEVSRLESPVPVELYTSKFFKANPTPSLFDALQNVNGVKPQLNCNICNTGDIHINGLEGPYTMILIDGMPIVSGLSTVYGLSGIPQSLIERVEVVKGPASTLYGSEAVGGLINVITKRPTDAPVFSTDFFATSWGEISADIAGKFSVGKKAQSLVGVSYFNYLFPVDNNHDGFTDVTLQNRISVFNKWNFERKNNRTFSLAGRYVYEDRWGGEMNWNKKFRGGDSIYAESIYTKRWELFGTYQLPIDEIFLMQFSVNGHNQNSVYGNTSYIAEQYVAFGQLTWSKQLKKNELLVGAAFRYTFYDDNTPATASFDTLDITKNMPSNTYLPGVFIQDEIDFNQNNKLLLGLRFDYNSIHGSILTPRINYKWNSKNKRNVLRISVGNGYRVANVFTEDHAALTGSRKVEFIEKLKPETSWNGNINFVKKIYTQYGAFVGIDATAFYTYFTNKIIADYLTDPNKIIYKNLNGYAVSRGVSLNLDVELNNGFKFLVGGTFMDVYSVEDNVKMQQLFTEHFTGVWNIGYMFRKIGLSIDYTGNLYSPMKLPLQSESDPRRATSPWWSIQNIQITKKFKKGIEIYCGVKNLLDWTPNKGNPFIIARANDPFDKGVQFDTNGRALVTPNNPYGLTFDPSYIYGPNQGIRGFVGIRYVLK
jgi:outer membrane receptor for ferrienterochelin and colicins